MMLKKRLLTFLLFCSMLFSLCVTTGAVDYPVEVEVLDLAQILKLDVVSSSSLQTFLPPNNSSGTNGNRCGFFTADGDGAVFIMTYAPGTLSCNVQLYRVDDEGNSLGAVSNYTTLVITEGQGAVFTGLEIGADYCFKISSNTAPQNGTNARYTIAAFNR